MTPNHPFPKLMLHVTFRNGQTMLFRPWEKVWVCDWIENDYVAGERRGRASDVIKPGFYIIEHDEYGPVIEVREKVAAVKEICVNEKRPFGGQP